METIALAKHQLIICVKCEQSYLPKEIYNVKWIDPQCKKCYNKRKREYYHKKYNYKMSSL